MLGVPYVYYCIVYLVEKQVNNKSSSTSLLLPSKVFNSVKVFLHRVSKIYHKIL